MLTGMIRFAEQNANIEIREYFYRIGSDRNPLTDEDYKELDGALTWIDLTSNWIEEVIAKGLKLVNCSRDLEGYSEIASVGIDIEAFCTTIVDFACTFQPVNFAGVGVNFIKRPHAKMLCSRMVEYAASRHLNVRLFELKGDHPDEKRSRIEDVQNEYELLHFLSSLQTPAFIWCENDFIARMVLNAASFLKLIVPDQITVVGSGDYTIGTNGFPTITTIPRPSEEIGYVAAEVLMNWILTGSRPITDILVPPPALLLRQSTEGDWELLKSIQKAHQLIKEEACDGLTVEAICRRVLLSRVVLTEHFSRVHGISPGAAIKQQKIEHAQQLLVNRDLSIGEISNEVGFSEQAKFSKFFKRHTGLTPREYRNKHCS